MRSFASCGGIVTGVAAAAIELRAKKHARLKLRRADCWGLWVLDSGVVDCRALSCAKARNDGSGTRLVWCLWITKEAAAAPCFAARLKPLAMTEKS